MECVKKSWVFDETRPLYVIGDVHGCFKTLCALIEKLPQKWESQLIFVGDLVDRGEDSCAVVELVRRQNYACILGNHEELMLEYYQMIPSVRDVWLTNGGSQTIRSYGNKKTAQKMLKEHLEFLKTLPYSLEVDYRDSSGKKLFVTHGFGLPFIKICSGRVEYINESNYSWNRLRSYNVKFFGGGVDYPIFNVFGHDVQKEGALMTKNFAAIDTGCVYADRLPNAALSAIEWPSKRIFKHQYCG